MRTATRGRGPPFPASKRQSAGDLRERLRRWYRGSKKLIAMKPHAQAPPPPPPLSSRQLKHCILYHTIPHMDMRFSSFDGQAMVLAKTQSRNHHDCGKMYAFGKSGQYQIAFLFHTSWPSYDDQRRAKCYPAPLSHLRVVIIILVIITLIILISLLTLLLDSPLIQYIVFTTLIDVVIRPVLSPCVPHPHHTIQRSHRDQACMLIASCIMLQKMQRVATVARGNDAPARPKQHPHTRMGLDTHKYSHTNMLTYIHTHAFESRVHETCASACTGTHTVVVECTCACTSTLAQTGMMLYTGLEANARACMYSRQTWALRHPTTHKYARATLHTTLVGLCSASAGMI